MKKQVSLLLALLLVVTMLTTACNTDKSNKEPVNTDQTSTEKKDSTEPQILKISLPGNPTDLNPLTSQDTASYETVNAMYDGLTRMGEGGKIEPGLAESWTVSEDGKTYTFKIRDAKWSDGNPITAADFEYSWKKALSPEIASPYSYLLYSIENGEDYNTGKITDVNLVGCKALDDKTFEVKLNQPVPYFPSLITMAVCMAIPNETLESVGADFALSPDKMIVSGPFKMTEWVTDQSITLEKNEKYWDKDVVKLEKIVIECVKEINTMANMFDTGDLDMMLVQPEFIDKYKEDPGFGQQADAVVGYLKFNFLDEYFANKNIRKAFSLSLNRNRDIIDVMQTGSTPAYGYVPPVVPGKEGGDFRSQNGDLVKDMGNSEDALKEAKDCLDKGLKEMGKTLEDINKSGLSIVASDSDQSVKFCQVIQQEWKENLGVDVEIKALKYALRQAEYDSKKYNIGKEGWGADYNDPMTFLDLFMTKSPQNDLNWSNAKYDELLEKASVTTGDERMGYMLEAEKILFDECVIMPTEYETRSYIQKTYVKGNIRNGVGVKNEYKWAYIEGKK